ncbi:hypothetical protein PHPALM_20772 [Phytophthora palmivora]|uniref:TFIIS central domain-containing protein n=1 Tax=Phytophthora palmivora TaxID=4796 RepID=A0A2P4XE04_9STRA|nr:hypothetical protein PHPALM_20772 [Phytophthora palmivora]
METHFVRRDEEEDDDTWVLELEEELDLGGSKSSAVDESKVELEEKPAVTIEQTKEGPPSVAAMLPHEVLTLIISFGQVGRVYILRSLDTNAVTVALDVEAELYAAFGQSYSLTKAYAHKARTLLFNLKDSRNVDLRKRLLSGELPSHSLVRMSGPDMANPQLARQRKEWIRKRTHEVMRDGREAEAPLSLVMNTPQHQDEDYEDFFSTDLFVNRVYTPQEFDFGVVKQTLLSSHAASTDHDLTGQVVWPVSAFLAWYLVTHRDEIAGKNVVELGAGAGLSGLVASQFAAHTALTDGNDIVLELLQENAETNADSSKVQALPLLWGDHESVEAFERAFPHPVDMLIGADVVCWPILVKPILQTVKYLLLRSRNPLETKFCCGFVCRAQSTEELLFKEALAFGFRFERVQGDAFVPTPRPAEVTSDRELQLIVFMLDSQAPNWNEPVRFADAELANLQTAC